MADLPPVLDYGESTYERDFWLGHSRDYEDAAERYALRSLLPPRGDRLIDIGAGYGRLAGLYAGYRQVILLDYSPDMLRDARARLPLQSPLTVAANFYDIPLADGACDTAVMVRVLHHAADAPRVLHELRRILRPGGTLILEHANKRHLKAVLRYALGRGPSPFTAEPEEFARLNYDFHPRYIRDHLHDAGFAVECQRAVSIFRIALLKRLVPAHALARLDALLQRPLAPLHLAPSVFLRCRATGAAGERRPDAPLFRCPRCHVAALDDADPAQLVCRQCGTAWPIVGGVYHLR